jgi:serine/threonine-protein kinase
MASDSPQPRVLGRYGLYEKIASGGMASVHIGRLRGPVGFARTVAIKRMHPHFAEDPEFVSMFLDEARLAARIRHPNVVPTLDVVALAGELFIVMEFVHGESLARLIRGASAKGEHIPPEMVATILVGVLHGLHAAHEAKSEHGEPLDIVHRDVSPHNVLVGTDGVARVLDFGVAKAAGRAQTTREGQLKGKLAYMAPEQIRGSASRVTDVYAASVVLWEALTGKRLFVGDNDAHVFDQVLRGCSVPPSAHVKGLPPALDAVTMRGLHVDPASRFPTARDMARAIEEAMPLAPASRIGDWVEAMAKETLAERSARIASIESESGAYLPAPSPSSPGENEVGARPPRPPAATVPESAARARGTDLPSPAPSVATPASRGARPAGTVTYEMASPTQLSTGSASTPSRAAPLEGRARMTWLWATGGVLALVGAAALGRAMGGPAPAASSAVAASAVAASAPPAPVASASTVPTAPAVSEAGHPTAEPAPWVPVAASAPLPSAPSAAAPTAKRPPAVSKSCDPPYVINEAGHRERKPGCL